MAEIGISVAAKAAEYTVDPIATQLGYMWNYETNFEILEKQLLKLEVTRATVQHSVEEATRNAEEIEQKVVNWLDSVNKINEEATKIIEDNNRANMRCFKSLCPDLKMRYQHSKKAADKANNVSVLQNEGKFDRISYRNLPEETWHPSSKPFEDFESRTSTLTYVINALSNPDVYMVGVHGMGGIGKTTLAREVGKKTEESKIFDVVVFVEVSESPDIRTIQGVIADKLGLEFRQETEPGRANTLRERLKKETKILLILDNIWESLDLENVGIPFNDDHRGCKLLLTARKANILSDEMGCDCENNFPIGILNENEAWDLFKKIVGSCVEGPNLQSLALDVAKECGGLPIAIVTVAKALKNKQECEWKNALQELQHPLESLKGSVVTKAYSCIQLSYNHLDTEELKSTFLLCCTMECTYKASIEWLLRYGVGLNLFKTIKTMEEARYRVNTLIRKLKSSSLLLDTPDSKWFSIHDVVRDVGRAIAFKDQNKFTVTDDVIPREWKDKNTMKNCTSISLHDITKLPNTELYCPLLQFLYMKSKNEYSKIPDNFFIGMLNLRVLHLINMELSPHPLSLRCLVNLQTLCLNCSWLREIGFIADIKDLEILVLTCKTIEQLPIEIGQLTQLRVLDLSQCNRLEIVPTSIISKLTQLEELYLDYGFDNWHVEGLDNESGNASLDELKHLSQLTTLRIRIRDHKNVPKGLFSQKLQRYNICIGSIYRRDCRSTYGTSKTLKLKSDDSIVLEDGVVTQLKGIEELCIDGRQSIKNALYELDSDGFPKLKHFDILNNPDLVYIVDWSKKWELPCDVFPLLETLSLTNLIGLEKICHGQPTPNSFCRLRTIKVYGCDNLKNMFSLSIAKHLSQLQDISVSNCKNMEDIFTIGRRNDINSNEEIDRVVLDQLHSLSLRTLPKLRSFCSEAEVFASTSNKIIPIPLFDRKVQLPNLKTLNLYEVNFETIWHHQLPTMSPCFQNLTHLSVRSCNNLKYIFSFSTLGSFVQLQDLTIRECKVLEAIVRIDALGNNVEHPSLKKLKINTCHEIKAIIFDDKVSFPNLEEIQISNMKNLEMIWHNQLTKDSIKNAQHCQKLCKVDINSCKSLKTLFPLSTATNLFQLKDLNVTRCDGIEEIVAKEGAEDVAARTFVFPQLTCLTLEDLQKFKCFYPGIHTIEWPVLKELNFIGCEKIDELFALELFTFQKNILGGQLDISAQPLSLVKKVFSNLENLRLDGNSSRMISQSQFPEILFPKLKHLKIKNQIDQPADLPLEICQRSHNLESLSLEGGSNKEIFWFEAVKKQTLTKKLSISGFENLEQIWKKDSKVNGILQNFEELYVSGCDSLVTLIPPSACFQNLTVLKVHSCGGLLQLVSSSTAAKSLVGLKEMKIQFCCMMTKVVADDEGAITEDEIINFSKLKSLELVYLSRLTSFSSWNYTFNFPSLERLSVENCPKMKTFASGVVLTPMLREIKLDNKDYYCEGDVNTSMQQIHEKLFFSNERLSLSLEDIKMILQKFPEHRFSRLKGLAVSDDFSDDESTVLPFQMLQRSHNLEQLKLADRSNKEILLCEEVEKQAETLAQLSLKELPTMSPFFQNLTDLSIRSCNNLKYLFSFSTLGSFVQLQGLTIRECKVLEAIIRIDEVGNNVEHPSLKKLRIEKCPEMKAFIFNDKEGAEDAAAMTFVFPHLTCLKLEDLQELRCFYPGIYTMEWPVLKELNLIGCDKIDHSFASELFAFQKNILESQPDIPAQPLSLVKKVFSNLENLRLDGNSSRMISQSQFPEILFPKLKHLKIKNQIDQPAGLPLEICQRPHNLESLSLEGGSNKEIFWFEVVGKYTLTKKLSISGFGNLEQIWKKDSKVNGILQNLEELHVSGCDSLVTLIPPSACFQNLTILTVDSCKGLLQLLSSSTAAKSLMGLKEMNIRFCDMMTRVVADDEGAITEDEIINFSKLKSLKLVDLSRLTSFCSLNYTFNFPSLETLYVQNCPKMKTFASGVVVTPMLREIKLDYKDYYCEGDVNTSMQQIHEKLVFSGERLSLSPKDIKMILQKSPEHQFPKLKSLEVFDDESTAFPSGMIQRFHNLEKLKLIDSSYKEIFIREEVEKHADTLARLKSLDLKKLDNLEQIWKQDSKLDIILHTLETLRVVKCNSLITLIPASASFQNLKSLQVWRCNGLISLLSSSTAKSLVRLEDMGIEYCNTMTKIVATEDVEEDKIVIFSKLRSLRLIGLSSLASFCSGNHTTLNFPSLESLYVIKCPKMKFFSSGVSSTPLLQRIRYDLGNSIWEGDLNTTIQWIHEELNPKSSTTGCVSHIE